MPTLRLADQSWTFEGWIYPMNLAPNSDYPIIGHFQAHVLRKYLHLIIRNQRFYFGLYYDDLSAKRVLQNSRWYHFAFVINCGTGQRWIYIDGRIDITNSSNLCYEGIGTNLTFGTASMNVQNSGFNGLIDQISFTNRSKSSTEILDDATLVAYFPFDNNTVADQGPLCLSSRSFGNISLSPQGRYSNALLIHNSSPSYLRIENLVRLGDSSYDYSFALWIKPSEIRQSTLIHVSSTSDGSSGWCLPFLGFNSSGYLLPRFWPPLSVDIVGPMIRTGVWTHFTLTYSAANSLRLYVNGSLYGSSIGTYSASGVSNYVFIGSVNAGTNCYASSIIGGQYHGFIDEFRIYSRELILSEIQSLIK